MYDLITKNSISHVLQMGMQMARSKFGDLKNRVHAEQTVAPIPTLAGASSSSWPTVTTGQKRCRRDDRACQASCKPDVKGRQGDHEQYWKNNNG